MIALGLGMLAGIFAATPVALLVLWRREVQP